MSFKDRLISILLRADDEVSPAAKKATDRKSVV